jgi:Cu/Ag efflux protein CusF
VKPFYSVGLLLLLAVLTLSGCRSGSDAAKEKTYDLKGTIQSVDLKSDRPLTLAHQDIVGLMPAMTMPFHVADGKLVNGLKPGDRVQGKLKVEDGKYVITTLEKLP